MESPAVFTSKILTLSSRFDLYCRIYCNIAKKTMSIFALQSLFLKKSLRTIAGNSAFAVQPEIRKPR